MDKDIKSFIINNYSNNTLVKLSDLIKTKFDVSISPKRLSDVTRSLNLSKLTREMKLEKDEEFKTIPGFTNYEVSQYCKVRNIGHGNYLTEITDRRGYITIKLTDDANVKRNIPLHRLVAYAWIPNGDESKNQIDHIDNDKKNNLPHNLEWVTPKENIQRARDDNLNKSKPPGRNFRLPVKIVEGIYSHYLSNKDNINYAEIGRLFGVSPNTAKRIINKERYTDITDKLD